MISKTVKGIRVIINQDGIIDLDSLYSDMKKWFDSKRYDFYENEYETKQEARGQKIKYVWTGERKTTDFVKFIIKVNFFIKEVLPEKNKISGKLSLKIESSMELDHENRWQDTKYKSFLFAVHNNLLKKQEIKDLRKKLVKETESLAKIAKQNLNLET